MFHNLAGFFSPIYQIFAPAFFVRLIERIWEITYNVECLRNQEKKNNNILDLWYILAAKHILLHEKVNFEKWNHYTTGCNLKVGVFGCFSSLAEILKTSENEPIIFWLEFEPDHYILYRDDVIPEYLTIIQTQIINQMVSLFIVLSYICIRLNGEYF